MFQRATLAALTATLLTAGAARAENVEIYLTDTLDNIQNGYCVDISGGQGADANPDNGLQGHTCYSPSGELFVDQTFDTEKFAEGLLYMPDFDVCAEVSGFEAGATVGLAACDGSEAQGFIFTGEGTISPTAAPELCFTLGEDTRFGRSQTNQIKDLTLAACDADLAAYQTWAVRTADY